MATVEHQLATFIEGKGEATLRDMVEGFGAERGISRGAVVKMVDRLFKKGLIERETVDHVFRYRLAQPLHEVEAGYVRRFVEARLRGEVAPLLAFLANATELSEEDRQTLQAMVERIEETRES